MRHAATISLGKIEKEEAITTLLNLLDDDDFEISKTAVKSLINLGEFATPYLIQSLDTDDDFVKEWLIYIMGEIGDEQSVPSLISLTTEQNDDVRFWIADALGKFTGANVIELLIKMLNDKSPNVRYIAAKGLGKIADDTAVFALTRILDDEDSRVRFSTVEALGKIGSKLAIPFLEQISLQDEEIIFNIARRKAITIRELAAEIIEDLKA